MQIKHKIDNFLLTINPKWEIMIYYQKIIVSQAQTDGLIKKIDKVNIE